MGITQKFLDTYKKKAGVNVTDVKELTKKDAISLYKAEWDSRGFGLLDNTDVMKLVYDFSVNVPKLRLIFGFRSSFYDNHYSKNANLIF